MKKVELLAPAGGIESLYAAVNAGADAIYLGGTDFGARRSAENFDRQAMLEVIRYAHQRGVAIYVTVNTLIKPEEFDDALQYVAFLYRNDVDAVILQDIGLYNAIRRGFPGLQCHASTQMTLHSTSDVSFAETIGFDRVVLSRELHYDEICEIKKSSDLLLEVFAHGALCIAYSGQCLFSSHIGGRSGNRGACAQPCRKKYKLLDSVGRIVSNQSMPYLMSPRDLNTHHHIYEMMALAPISLKIEGRMKSPEYVFAVVSAYRHALDGVGCEEDINMLSRVFNRRYTAGHLWQSPFKDFMNYELPSHFGTILGKVIESRDGEIVLRLMDDIAMGDEMQKRFNGKTVGGRVEQLFKGREKIMAAHCGDTVRVNFKHRAAVNDVIYKTYDTQYLTEIERTRQISHAVYGLTMRFDAVIGERAILAATDENGEKVTVYSTNDVACARKISLDAPRVEQQLGKLGGTVYYMTAVETAIDTQAALPVSEINHMRREAVDFLMSKRAVRYPERQTKAVDQMAPSAAADITKAETQIAQTKVTSDVCLDIHVYHSEQLTKVTSMKRKHRILIHDLTYFRNTMAAAVQNRHVPVLPVIIRNREWPQVKTFIEVYVQTCESLKCEPVVCIGHVAHLILGDLYPSLQFILDSTCNLMNQSALDFVFEKQIDTTYLATEMKRDEIAALDLTDKAFGYNAFGHLTLMQSAYCAVGGVLAGHSHCGACQHESYQLEDEHGHSFPLICNSENCHMTVLSEYPISVLDQLNALASLGVRNFKIDMVGLSPEKIQNLIDHLDEHKPLTFKTGGRRFVEKGID